ncbi:MAG TPA: hypothetical protein VKT77_13965 [Chthonomonadaceae bacterium]|nr:hypothetical protein [Chthonomonadaceae bacterium]
MSNDQPAVKPPLQELDDWFLDLLECPGCDYHRPLRRGATGDALLCDCGRYAYPVRDGIPILLVEEAVIVDETADPAVGAQGART